MRVLRGFRDLGRPEGTVSAVTMGNFDGVHRGHQAVIRAAVDDATARRVDAVVVTFDPHTRAVLADARRPRLLQTLGQRLASIEVLGADVAVVIPFDEGVAATTREEFVERFLVDELGAVALHVSGDFRFGRDGEGTVEYLRRVAPERGFAVSVVVPVQEGDGKICSTRIRRLVEDGGVEEAHRLLGRAYALEGVVVPGDQRGRLIGVPTANVAVENGCVPGVGVYAGRVRIGDSSRGAVVNVGHRPTFGALDDPRVETHVLDFSGDLYGRGLEIAFARRLRDEIRFDGAEALVTQIREDIGRARGILDGTRDAR